MQLPPVFFHLTDTGSPFLDYIQVGIQPLTSPPPHIREAERRFIDPDGLVPTQDFRGCYGAIRLMIYSSFLLTSEEAIKRTQPISTTDIDERVALYRKDSKLVTQAENLCRKENYEPHTLGPSGVSYLDAVLKYHAKAELASTQLQLPRDIIEDIQKGRLKVYLFRLEKDGGRPPGSPRPRAFTYQQLAHFLEHGSACIFKERRAHLVAMQDKDFAYYIERPREGAFIFIFPRSLFHIALSERRRLLERNVLNFLQSLYNGKT